MVLLSSVAAALLSSVKVYLVHVFVSYLIRPIGSLLFAVIPETAQALERGPVEYSRLVRADDFGEGVIGKWSCLMLGVCAHTSSVCRDCSPVCRGARIINQSHTWHADKIRHEHAPIGRMMMLTGEVCMCVLAPEAIKLIN